MVQVKLNPYRCTNCGRLLGYFVVAFGAQIKCQRCKELNDFNVIPAVEVLTDTPNYVSVSSESEVEVIADVPEVVVLKE